MKPVPPDEVLQTAARNFIDRALHCRSGMASVNQTLNLGSQKSQACLNLRNDYLDANLDCITDCPGGG